MAKFYLVTDAVARRPVGRCEVEIDGTNVTRHVWDLSRLLRLESAGCAREPISIDLVDIVGSAIPCIAGPQTTDHSVYLTIFPGEALAAIYNEHGPRLLERNVRSFLQARGSVNRGIRDTILESPDRFLAYNNGISATAAEIDLVSLEGGGWAIAALHDFQIVNGGQTTASIATAVKKDHAYVGDIAVQAKITVVENSVIDELVRHISQYSNTQNKVAGADFSANDSFHQAIEHFSRDIRTPASSVNGETSWYYERARGSYADDLGRARTPAEKRKFRALFPSRQKFTKTDLAKFEHSWEQLPHFVSLGAEKNFREFTIRRSEKKLVPDIAYFHRLVAKAILFRRTEQIVSEIGGGGFRANIVTYVIAKLAHATAHRLDLEKIWTKQELSPATEHAIRELVPKIENEVRNPRGRSLNPTEWAKKKDLWDIVRELDWNMPSGFSAELIALHAGRVQNDEVVIDRGINTTTASERVIISEVADVPADTWYRVSNWAKETNNLQPWQRSLAYSLGKLAARGQTPSAKQAAQGAKLLHEARSLGFV